MPFRMPFRIGACRITRTAWIPGLVFAAALACGQVAVHLNLALHARGREFSTQQLVNTRAADIERNLSYALASTYILAQEVLSRHLTLAGPFPLRQGGVGMVGRNPVFLDAGDGDAGDGQRFWGFASALILLDHLLARTDIAALSAQRHAYELGRRNPATHC